MPNKYVPFEGEPVQGIASAFQTSSVGCVGSDSDSDSGSGSNSDSDRSCSGSGGSDGDGAGTPAPGRGVAGRSPASFSAPRNSVAFASAKRRTSRWRGLVVPSAVTALAPASAGSAEAGSRTGAASVPDGAAGADAGACTDAPDGSDADGGDAVAGAGAARGGPRLATQVELVLRRTQSGANAYLLKLLSDLTRATKQAVGSGGPRQHTAIVKSDATVCMCGGVLCVCACVVSLYVCVYMRGRLQRPAAVCPSVGQTPLYLQRTCRQ
jgi:hypothetical protein